MPDLTTDSARNHCIAIYAVECEIEAKGEPNVPQAVQALFVRWNAHATPLRVHSTGQILFIDLPGAITRVLACGNYVFDACWIHPARML